MDRLSEMSLIQVQIRLNTKVGQRLGDGEEALESNCQGETF